MSGKVVCLIVAVVLGAAVGAWGAFDTVRVYDPNDEPHHNQVDQSGIYDSHTGNAGVANVIDLEAFQALIGPAFDADAGGVVNGESDSGSMDDQDIIAHFGIGRTKSVTFTSTSGIINRGSSVKNNRRAISGSARWAKSNTADFVFDISPVTGGAPGEAVTHFAGTLLHRDNRDIGPVVTATFSGGGTVTATADMTMDGPVNSKDTFFGFVAPPGQHIVNVNFDLANYTNLDDIAFMTSAFVVVSNQATNRSPAVGAVDVPQDVVLSWAAGHYADTHDVYFGTDPSAVAEADSDHPLDVLVSPGQDANTYDPIGHLEFGQTYYWRVDEVNAPPDLSVFKGDVWSFTVEPLAYPVENITATASSSGDGVGPENTIDGSGLDVNDLHSVLETDMWLSVSDPNGAWIQYEFDRVYKLYEMWVWNYNVSFEPVLGYGFKAVAVEVSENGEDWTVLDNVEFERATAQANYAPNTTVDLGGVAARYVRLTASSNWSTVGLHQYGLSEVRFLYIPAHAREPQPADGAAGAGPNVVLSWRAGREAAVHDVYFSADRQAVLDGTALVDSVAESSYDLGPLDLGLGQLYYWKIDEVNEAESPSLWPGDLWSFSTPEFLVVDDFESYTDEVGGRIFQTWIDGFGYTEPEDVPGNGTGATVGYLQAPFAEQTIVNGGNQSMPLEYNNADAPWYSEAERTWATPQDWTTNGIDLLRLHFRGNPMGFVETEPGTITMSAAGADIWDMSDEFTFAYKPLNGDGSVTVRVDSIENTDVWAKAGVMIRDTLDASAKNAMAYVTPDGRVGWQYRQITAGTSSSTRSDPGTITLPYWVRLTREGNRITAEHSADGQAWEPMVEAANPQEPSSLLMPMNAGVFIGIALTSHSAGVVNTSEFSSAATSGAAGQWQFAEIGVDHLLNERDDLYIAVQDSAGRVAVVTHPDPDAVLVDTWQQWAIPTADLSAASVNLAAVTKMYIGVGDRNNPAPNGGGLIFIDDIGVGHPGLADPGDSGLVASYALENNVEDGSGNGQDGTIVGEPDYVEGPAGYGTAMEFDGTGDEYVVIGTFDPSAATGQLSVALWARWNGLNGAYQGLIAKRDSHDAADMMWHLEAHRDTGVVRVGRQGTSTINGEVMAEGEWEHWGFTFDGSQVILYRNGQDIADGAFSFGSDQEASLVFGAVSGTGSNAFYGALDEVRIYDRALAAFEMSYLAGQQ